jgi:ubiquinone/menaquinone biosynthesis C-methylase UbiE
MRCGSANFSSGGAYERYMGRWSRLVAPEFLEWLSIPAGGRWSEVGSGTGELTRAILSQCDPKSVLRADPSVGLIERAREVVQDDRVSFEVGGAEELPGELGVFDAVVSGLVLNFIPDVDAGIASIVRAARPGGTVAEYV